jgi:hypothetical protein
MAYRFDIVMNGLPDGIFAFQVCFMFIGVGNIRFLDRSKQERIAFFYRELQERFDCGLNFILFWTALDIRTVDFFPVPYLRAIA